MARIDEAEKKWARNIMAKMNEWVSDLKNWRELYVSNFEEKAKVAARKWREGFIKALTTTAPPQMRKILSDEEKTKTIIMKEKIGNGTRGGSYIYVVDGKELVHISDYATKRMLGKYGDEVVYEVLVDKIAGKILYCFNFSRSGGAFLGKCKIEDFEDGCPEKYEYFGSLEKHIHEIRDLEFRVKDPTLLSLVTQFKQLFIPMIQEIKQYEKMRGFRISFRQERLRNAFEDPEAYYFTFMSLPNDRNRIKSLKVTRRWIYQLWTLKLLCDALRVSEFKGHAYEGRPYWRIEQGSDFSTAIAGTPFGDITFWLEFQPSKYAHILGMFAKRRVPIRPDIVVAKGCFERTDEFINSKRRIDLIVECKEDPFDAWKNEIESQIFPYQEIFKPDNFIIASLEHVPDTEKKYLERREIRVVDDLRANSRNIITFYNLVRERFETS